MTGALIPWMADSHPWIKARMLEAYEVYPVWLAFKVLIAKGGVNLAKGVFGRAAPFTRKS